MRFTEESMMNHPRPALARDSWQSLDGLWRYAITDNAGYPGRFDGNILVPYSPEAPLSGVNRQLQPTQWLHYERTFTCSTEPDGRVLLHFGAVDHFCRVFINSKEASSHRGGYLPFTLDITALLQPGENLLYVAVQDPSDTGHQARGKQKLARGGMYYTAQSGIWQSVWLERVPAQYVRALHFNPILSRSCVQIEAQLSDPCAAAGAQIEITAQGQPVACGVLGEDGTAELDIPRALLRLWSPDDPFLYDAVVTLTSGDRVTSYFAMREYGMARDAHGILRFTLNGKPILLNGLLDQGYWPEGLYTPPSDEAMVRDIQTMKDMGFNLLRKHVKIEPQRWYYHCDRLGMIVWQDMPNGGGRYNAWFVTYAINVFHPLLRRFPDTFRRLFARTDEDERARYYEELEAMVHLLRSHPCMGSFVPFNEGWGQFDAPKATALVRRLDPQKRPIDEASGWFDQGGGDMYSLHNYFYPLRVKPGRDRVVALTEYGGVAWACPGHLTTEKSYGYCTAKSQEEFAAKYEELMLGKVLPQLKNGLSALLYTQVSDVEDEINGLMTYDREVVKLPMKTALKCARALEDEFARCIAP
ncbi:MAG: glycoside hydrolase family 2 [Clostridia bacterium]|nr:glycoside hydrolase family 2 [Clostridia bacterium]